MGKRSASAAITVLLCLIIGVLMPATVSAGSCDTLVARIISAEGVVQAQAAGRGEWFPVGLDHDVCAGDMIRVRERGRAAIRMMNDTVLRIDQNTTITFPAPVKEATWLIDIIKGIVHFLSRVPRTLEVSTPFVNGTVEGTEFLVRVSDDRTEFLVFEGAVVTSNDAGSLTLASGDSATATRGEAPRPQVVVRPRDAVQWALYYPPIMEYRSDVTQDAPGTDDMLHRASLLLTTGRVEEAQGLIGDILASAPDHSGALALSSVVAVVQNDREGALDRARKAVGADPAAAPARIALSYAQQAGFDLAGARESLTKAVELEPQNALAWSRLAEVRLSFGDLDAAREAAERAAELNPGLARTQTVLGFAYLSQVKTEEATDAFEKAVQMDQADPLPRLGLGLAKIRGGDLKGGREEIETAAILDPNNSLVRSYLGKAYYEEKRDALATDQYAIARETDPMDPTPFFYGALQKQSLNRPVEALHDLQSSVELNDNRAVYRSRLLLDDDLAARSASLARIYQDLGFQQLALVEGWRSVNTDPGNHSAHRFLADSYAALPRHEIARVSELLQSQLLQPLNMTPVQPQLSEGSLFITSGAGPGTASFHEFTPLFHRNGYALQVSAIAGENSTFGNDLVVSGIHGNMSISAGQFYYETDGFRENNDQTSNLYNLFFQMSPTHRTSIQAEYRSRETEKGDLSLNFDPDSFFSDQREDENASSLRFGVRHRMTSHVDLLVSYIAGSFDENFRVPPVIEFDLDEEGHQAETQVLAKSEWGTLIAGAGYFRSDTEETTKTSIIIDPLLPPMEASETLSADTRHTNLYLYSLTRYPGDITLTMAGSADDYKDSTIDRSQLNPKLGVAWQPGDAVTLRAAVFRTLKRSLVSDQTLEPTQVAGFNQFFDNANGTDSWRYGVASDARFSQNTFGGLELTRSEMDVPYEEIVFPSPPEPPIPFTVVREADWRDDIVRSYLYWTPRTWLAVSGEYRYEALRREDLLDGYIEELKTHRLPLGIRLFSPSGFSAGVTATFVKQKGMFFDQTLMSTSPGSDRFWVVDASVGYRLPKRFGVISVEAKNLFDEEFRFQDSDPANPKIYPKRYILGKCTLAF